MSWLAQEIMHSVSQQLTGSSWFGMLEFPLWKETLHYLGYLWEGWEGSSSLDIGDVPRTASFTDKATNSRRSLAISDSEHVLPDSTKTHPYIAFADCFTHPVVVPENTFVMSFFTRNSW